MSMQELFNRAYRNSVTRGHVVHSVVTGYRQMHYGPGPGTTAEEAHAMYRFAERIADAADAFYLAVKPRFRLVFKDIKGRKLRFVEAECPVCGHPYCGLYTIAPMVPVDKTLPMMVVPVQPGER